MAYYKDKLVKMVHKATMHTYLTRKNRKKLSGIKFKMRKYNPILRKHVDYVEMKP